MPPTKLQPTRRRRRSDRSGSRAPRSNASTPALASAANRPIRSPPGSSRRGCAPRSTHSSTSATAPRAGALPSSGRAWTSGRWSRRCGPTAAPWGRPPSTWTSPRSRSAPPSTTTARTRTRSMRSQRATSKRPAARRRRCGARPRPHEGLPRRALQPEDRRRAAHPRSRRDQRPRSARARRTARRAAVRPHGRRASRDCHGERDRLRAARSGARPREPTAFRARPDLERIAPALAEHHRALRPRPRRIPGRAPGRRRHARPGRLAPVGRLTLSPGTTD
jgi:hypothetical protein